MEGHGPQTLLGEIEWHNWTDIFSRLDDNTDDKAFAMSLAAKIILYNASSFDRRLVQAVQEFPLRLLQFCDPSKAKDLASTLLQHERLEVNTKKFKQLFLTELIQVQSSGVLPCRLREFVSGLKKFWAADVRDAERTNKCVGMIQSRCPNIGPDLLSSRVNLKFYLGGTCAGAGLQGKRWSLFKPVAEGLKHLCLSGWNGKEEVMSNPERFTPPRRPENLPDMDYVKKDRGLTSIAVQSMPH